MGFIANSTTEMGRKGVICEILLRAEPMMQAPSQVRNLASTGTSMTASARSALALLLLMASSAQAQGPVPSGFVDAASVVDGLLVDMRYFGDNNVVGETIDGYERPRCLLSARAATALATVGHDLAARGLGLKAFDCYRPQRAVAHFVRWAQAIDDVKRKGEFYPDVDKRNLFKEGYIAERSGHSRGSTLDLTLVRRADGAFSGKVDSGFPQKMRPTEDASELDMGSPFDFFSSKSWPSDATIGTQARQNRALLAEAMSRGGFRPYDKEWWHFTLVDEPYPETYFDFPVR
jgi:D-alanyl-D-alanine dipeptidase